MFFFFFSSRRRHTRFDCDWSSDVCSSDLGDLDAAGDRRRRQRRERAKHRRAAAATDRAAAPVKERERDAVPARHLRERLLRSEERRVGKSVDLGGSSTITDKQEYYKTVAS